MSPRVECTTVTVEVKQRSVSPAVISVRRGDKIRFLWTSNGPHTVTQMAAPDSCTPATPLLFSSGAPQSGVGTELTLIVTLEDGEYYYGCTTHCDVASGGTVRVGGTCGVPETSNSLTEKQETTTIELPTVTLVTTAETTTTTTEETTTTTTTLAPTTTPTTTTTTTTTTLAPTTTTTTEGTSATTTLAPTTATTTTTLAPTSDTAATTVTTTFVPTTTTTTTTLAPTTSASSSQVTAPTSSVVGTVTTLTSGGTSYLGTTTPGGFTHSAALMQGAISLRWSVSDGFLHCEVRFPTMGWIGVGFQSDIFTDPLVHGDWIVGTAAVEDRWKRESDVVPELDTSMGGAANVEGEVFVVANQRGMRFRRQLSTGDKMDAVLSDAGLIRLSIMYSDSLTVSRNTRATVVSQTYSVNLGTGQVQTFNNSLVLVHAVLMAVAFGIVLVAGVAIGRFLPKNYVVWFAMHAITNALGIAMVIAAFALAFVFVGNSGTDHFSFAVPSRGAHQILGVITFAWLVMQGVLGVASKIVWEREFERSAIVPEARFFPNTLHRISGYCVPVAGFVTVFLGLWDWGVHKGWMGLWGGWGALVIAVFIVAELLRRRREKFERQERFVDKVRGANCFVLSPPPDFPVPGRSADQCGPLVSAAAGQRADAAVAVGTAVRRERGDCGRAPRQH